MSSLFESVVAWLDADRSRFWLVAIGATLLWGLSVIFETPGKNAAPEGTRGSWKLWGCATLLLMLAWRWPYLAGFPIMNPDEAQIVAGAITLKSYPLFWKYVDGTTHGPATDLPLLAVHALGLPLNYGTARFTSGLLILGGFVLAGRGLMLVYPAAAVRVGLGAAILLWASISFYDYTGYTSEQTSIFLFLAAIWPLLAGLQHKDSALAMRGTRLGLGGFLLGCIPYAKLQGIPLGLSVGGLAVIALFVDKSLIRAERMRLLAFLMSGALLPTAILGVYLSIWNLWTQFWASYILSNLVYAQRGWMSLGAMWASLWDFMKGVPGLQTFAVILLGLTIVVLILTCIKRRDTWPWLPPPRFLWSFKWRGWLFVYPWILLGALVIVASGTYASIAPKRHFMHYLQYLSATWGVGAAVLCGELWHRIKPQPRGQVVLAGCLVLIFCLIPWSITYKNPFYPDMFGLWTKHHGEWRKPASIAIAELAHPGNTMSVWGWMPYFHVETGLPQATREAHTYRQIEPGPMQEFYRNRYLFDFKRSTPRIFVDAVGGNNFVYDASRLEVRHESFPELSELIQRDYQLVREVNGSRIYLRRSHTTYQQLVPVSNHPLQEIGRSTPTLDGQKRL